MRMSTMLFASLLLAGAAYAQTAPSPLTGSVGTPAGTAGSGRAAPNPAGAPATSTGSAATSSGPAATSAATTASPAASAAPSSAPTRRHRRTLAERFDAANTTHDGHLTLQQARAGRLNAVARDFAQIDKDSKGFVTIDEIRTFQRERRAARRGARTGQPQPQAQ